MTKFKKAAGVVALAAASGLAFNGASLLVKDVAFARAEQANANTKKELQSVEDLSTVFRNVGRAVEPSVVQIEVRKTVHAAGPGGGNNGGENGLPNNPQLRKFFRDHGMNVPDGNGNGDENDNNDDQQSPNGGDDGLIETGTGSGVILEVDGSTVYILTNNHVAGGATNIKVTLADGREIEGGKTIGADPRSDLAVVRIKADHVIPATWGDSDQLSQGDWVLAFGSPLGYVGSMTHGIVSALHRQAGILGKQGYENFIQVDAPINPGNSGGPLVNVHGEVVGINTAIATRSGGFQGIGFAIPSDQAKDIYKALKEKGRVTRGYLGVEIMDVSREPKSDRAPGYTAETGVSVVGVPANSPSAGKLEPGDVITGIDGKPTDSMLQLRNVVAGMAPGAVAKMRVFRDGKQTDVPVTLGEMPDAVAAAGPTGSGIAPRPKEAPAAVAEAYGLHLTDVTDDLAKKFNFGSTAKQGAVVTAVAPRSLAFAAGVQVGDLITKVGSTPVASAADAAAALDKQDVSKGVRLYLTNADGSRFVFMQKE